MAPALALALVVLAALFTWAVWDEIVGRRPWKAYQERFAVLMRQRLKTARAKDAINRSSTGLQKHQLYLPGLLIGGVVDRCVACHLGIDTPEASLLEQPFTVHPGNWLTTHPKERFGCTSCHQGDGIATTSVAKAHGKDRSCSTPLLEGRLVQAGCLKCHDAQTSLPGAELLMEGHRLFSERGCSGCHRMRGFGEEEAKLAAARQDVRTLSAKEVEALRTASKSDQVLDLNSFETVRLERVAADKKAEELARELRRIGPDLDGVQDELSAGWIEEFLVDPGALRPRSRMGRFWPTARDARGEEESVAEIRAAIAYLWDRSRPKSTGRTPLSTAGGVTDWGVELVKTLGCKACHNIESTDAELFGPSRFAPDLTRTGEKTNQEWLVRFLSDPRSIRPHTRMPAFRLDAREAASLAVHLATRTRGPNRATPDYLTRPDRRGPLAAEGQVVIRRYGCSGCHAIPGFESQSRIGIDLSNEGSKQIEEFDPGLLAHEDQLQEPLGGSLWWDWLVARSDRTRSAPARSVSSMDAQAWLVRNCDPIALDAVRTLFRPTAGRQRPSLTRQGWIGTKLMNPRIWDRGRIRTKGERLRMPDLAMEPTEILALVTFLLAQTSDMDRVGPGCRYRPDWPKQGISAGEAVLQRFNCAGCHRLRRGLPASLVESVARSIQPDKPLVGQTLGSLPTVIDSRQIHAHASRIAPDLTLDTERRDDFVAEASNVYERALNEGDYELNLRELEQQESSRRGETVHLDGYAPPPLDFEGARVKPEWLFGFLKRPETLRTWLKVRMPTFDLSDGDARRVAAYFDARSSQEHPFASAGTNILPQEEAARASEIVERDCVRCHLPNPTPEKVAESAPDLRIGWRRLKPEWVASFSVAPQVYIPGTRMPQLFLLSQNAYPQFAKGEAVAQVNAIATYLSTYGLPLTTGSAAGSVLITSQSTR